VSPPGSFLQCEIDSERAEKRRQPYELQCALAQPLESEHSSNGYGSTDRYPDICVVDGLLHPFSPCRQIISMTIAQDQISQSKNRSNTAADIAANECVFF
jgi:hypothetical protein